LLNAYEKLRHRPAGRRRPGRRVAAHGLRWRHKHKQPPLNGNHDEPAAAQAASTVAVTDQEDSNWAGYVVASSATAKTSFSAVSGSWTQPTVDCAAGSPSHSAFWIGLGGYTGDHLEQTGTSADCSASGQASYSAWYELVPAAQVPVTMTVRPGDRLRIPRCLRQLRHPGHTPQPLQHRRLMRYPAFRVRPQRLLADDRTSGPEQPDDPCPLALVHDLGSDGWIPARRHPA